MQEIVSWVGKRDYPVSFFIVGVVLLTVGLLSIGHIRFLMQNSFYICSVQNSGTVYSASPIQGALFCVNGINFSPTMLAKYLPSQYNQLMCADLQFYILLLGGVGLIAVSFVSYFWSWSKRHIAGMVALVLLVPVELLFSPMISAGNVPFTLVSFWGLFLSEGSVGMDYTVLVLLLASTVLLLVENHRYKAIKAALVTSIMMGLAILPLPLEIGLFDNFEFNLHVANVLVGTPLAWFTNEVLLYVIISVLITSSVILSVKYH